ncbi:hypothetical protein FNV43_RR12873 [Rhamnella rubrinervis]|uniref:Uncharacterized protein n=1 Tax=Rhamnella rubrinervis TaxID=2594499 RepID=A0A8K0GZZ7_9ROSA|nr:hypothetical protein FNV43_RR12873 [Rhamnella rubrinervis]
MDAFPYVWNAPLNQIAEGLDSLADGCIPPIHGMHILAKLPWTSGLVVAFPTYDLNNLVRNAFKGVAFLDGHWWQESSPGKVNGLNQGAVKDFPPCQPFVRRRIRKEVVSTSFKSIALLICPFDYFVSCRIPIESGHLAKAEEWLSHRSWKEEELTHPRISLPANRWSIWASARKKTGLREELSLRGR